MKRAYGIIRDRKHPHWGCSGYVELDDDGQADMLEIGGEFHVEMKFTNCQHMETGAFVKPEMVKFIKQ